MDRGRPPPATVVDHALQAARGVRAPFASLGTLFELARALLREHETSPDHSSRSFRAGNRPTGRLVALLSVTSGLALAVALVSHPPWQDPAPAADAAAVEPASSAVLGMTTLARQPAGTAAPAEPGIPHMQIVEVGSGLVRRLPVQNGLVAWAPASDAIAHSDGRTVSVVDPATLDVRAVLSADDIRALDWSPDGRRLAVAADDGVTLLDRDGQRVGHTGAEHEVVDLAWSPDGREVAYRTALDTLHLFDAEKDATEIPATEVEGRFLYHRWLQDGRLLAVGSLEPGGFPLSLYDVHADGSVQALLPVPEAALTLAISGRGTHVAFVEQARPGSHELGTRLVSLSDGGELARFEGGFQTHQGQHEAFSSDGQRLWLVTDRCGSGSTLRAASVDGGSETLARTSPYSASWSPADSAIAYSEGTDLFVAASGGAPRLLVQGGVQGNIPAIWSPDGQRLLYWGFFGGFGACES